jgi:hypothetical protein
MADMDKENYVKCKKCGSSIVEVNREIAIDEEIIDELSEGEIADYIAAELAGCTGGWTETLVTYMCRKCKNAISLSI